MFPIMAVDEHLIYHAFGKFRTGDARQYFDVGESVYEVRSGCDEANAHAGRYRLRKATYVDDTVELIERRQAGGQRPLEIAANVVLDYREVAALGHLQHPKCGMRRHCRTGRILHCG